MHMDAPASGPHGIHLSFPCFLFNFGPFETSYKLQVIQVQAATFQIPNSDRRIGTASGNA